MLVLFTYTLQELEDYGIEWSNSTLIEENFDINDEVVVPRLNCPLSEEQLARLLHIVDPLAPCEDNGYSFYVQTKQMVRGMLALT